ncbi:uncharacterized protein LOC125034031 [Penaeus chinensis]|uniref:uncharacterized protein LOC125034031 n=1 Tax=Penaeus chinensis TaxID=139456 RepID=UPI001FB77086|nr:uncharacterized protein LOC125034031 [Penaeus chinensis]
MDLDSGIPSLDALPLMDEDDMMDAIRLLSIKRDQLLNKIETKSMEADAWIQILNCSTCLRTGGPCRVTAIHRSSHAQRTGTASRLPKAYDRGSGRSFLGLASLTWSSFYKVIDIKRS